MLQKKDEARETAGFEVFNRSRVTKWVAGRLLLLGLALLPSLGCDRPVTGADAAGKQPAAKAVPGPQSASVTAPTTRKADQVDSPKLVQPELAKVATAISPAPIAPASNQTVDSTFDDLKFDLEKTGDFDRSLLTPRIEQLFGQKIRIRGYIFPTLRKRGLKQFVLVRDNLECCFGPGAALYDCILVQMQAGKTAEYTIRPVAVEGILRFEPFIGPEGKHLAIFRLEGEQVE